MIIHENNNVKLEFDAEVPCIIWTPIKFMKGDNWRIPFTKGIDFLEEKTKTLTNITWLNDARNLKTVTLEDIRWLNSNVNDRAFEYGLRKVAFVLPENVYGKMAVKFYIDYTNIRTDNKFKIKAFKRRDDALTWLKNDCENNDIKEVAI